MLQGLVGQKLGMTQIFTSSGEAVPVSVVQVGPCRVVRFRTAEKDGYNAVQIAFQEVKENRLTQPVLGQFKKAGVVPARYLREFRGDQEGLEVGQVVTADLFQQGEKVDVVGISKGKGFAGVIKRHHFSGGPATHGSMFHRAPGSIGSSSFPSRVWKNKKLPGHMGSQQVTVKNLEVLEVRKEEGLLLIRGAVPGSPGTLLLIKKTGRKK